MMKMRKTGYIALAVLMVATLTLTGCSNVTEAKGSPTTEKEKVAEKTPQKGIQALQCCTNAVTVVSVEKGNVCICGGAIHPAFIK